MEKHRCKLCFRRFANGRALGGHMRSHMMNLHVPPKPQPDDDDDTDSVETASSRSSFSCASEEEPNPKKHIRTADHGSSSVVLQDRESETESSRNPTRRRSKRKNRNFSPNRHQINEETEPASSISEVTSEEDIAFCLMMLSRDSWNDGRSRLQKSKSLRQEEEEEEEELMDWRRPRNSSGGRGKYKCETCNKVFRSYQALGGHRASHKKTQALREECGNNRGRNGESSATVAVAVAVEERKIHQCPVCFRVFGSGQALGGHKRSHVMGVGNQSEFIIRVGVNHPPRKFTDNFIDLNLPAPADEPEFAHSAVSDPNL